ncbi:MAG: IS1 family transposase, partial [Nitrospiraceae bacterium]|nr:IS1 family transposase [Nitrospiraceae bacterium]
DEIWSFCYSKEKNVPEEHEGEFGYDDVWTFTAICADSKLVPSWRVGNRSLENAKPFIEDLARRLANRVQLTSDGHKMYLGAVEGAFGSDVDFAQLQKIYGVEREDTKYSPAKYLGATKVIKGRPDMKQVATSYVERQNLNMRMGMRRFTRLTNAFSNKVENHIHTLSLYFMFYNFCRIHKTLRVTPAMAAGVADHVWSIEEILSLFKKC